MKLETHIKLNDVSMKKLLATVLSLQITLWVVMELSALGVSIPIVQPLIGFIFLTFVPGILILTALRLRNLDIVETALYTIGLSVTVVISVGFVDTVVFNAFNVVKPFSFLAVTSSVSCVVLVLCAVAYFRNRTHPESLFNTKTSVPLAPTLFLCVIPFITVFSTYLVNTYNVSAGQLFLYLLLGIVVLLVAFDKFIPSKLYAFAVFVIAVSLLFQQTLISEWLTGWDIQLEWSLANAVLTTGVWNPNLPSLYSSMLSVVAVAPIYSLISNLDLVWIFKLIYPIIFALVPVGLYQIFRRQLNDKVAFLSCFFFTSALAFHTELPGVARQEIAELFFVLLILLLVSNEMNKRIQSGLFIAFSLSLAVSHYGMTYMLIVFLFVMWLVLTAVDGWKRALSYLRTKVGIHKGEGIIAPSPKSSPRSVATIVSILLIFIASTAWYVYSSQASVFHAVAGLGNQISGSITDLFNPSYSRALSAATQTVAPGFWHQVNAVTSYLNQFLILAGVCSILFLKKKRFKLQFSYIILSTIALGYLIASVAVPYLSVLDANRTYHITLIFLAPFLAIGFIEISENASVIVSKVKSKLGFGNFTVTSSRLTRVLAIYLVLIMLLQTGFIFALTEGRQTIALNNEIEGARYNHEEIVGGKWLVNNSGGQKIYADVFRYVLFTGLAPRQASNLPYPKNTSAGGFYTFIGTYNIEQDQAQISNFSGTIRQNYYSNVTPFISNRSLIYSNGGADVYW
jgi:uncharacterized membrane protein